MATKSARRKVATRPVFISHASHDADFVNYFVDTLLVGGIGIPKEQIFNTSAPTPPIKAGSNFNPEIRAAIQSARIVIALVTREYFGRPFAMAELGAAWAAERLIPVLVPPVDFSMLEGVLDGVQCIRANDKQALHELFDRFDQEHLNNDRWLARNGSGTFNFKLEEYLKALPSKLPSTPSAPPATPEPAPGKSAMSLKEEQAAFDQLVDEVDEALDPLPLEVQDAFAFSTGGDWGTVNAPDTEMLGSVYEQKHRGLLETMEEGSGSNRVVYYRPSRMSQRVRNVYARLDSLKAFLESASSEFHVAYEDAYGSAASPNLYSFWETHFLRELDAEPAAGGTTMEESTEAPSGPGAAAGPSAQSDNTKGE